MTEEWRRVRLGDVAAVSRQRVDPAVSDTQLLMHYSIPSLDETGRPTLDSPSQIKSHKFAVEKPSVLVSMLNPRIPRAWRADGGSNVVCSTEFAVTTPIDETLALPYLFLIARSEWFWEELQKRAVGTTGSRQRVKPAAMLDLEFDLPPLVVQRRIVDLMEHLDTHLANLETEQQSWNSFMKSLRARAFSDLDVPEVPAGEKFDMLLGRQKSERQSTGDHVIPYLRAANIGEAGFRLSDVGTMNFDLREQAKYGLRDGDVLLVEGGSIGLSALWTSQIPGTVGFDKHVIRLRPVEGTSTSSFALQWTRWCHESGAFDDQATGITIRALGFGRASQMPVPDLSVEQQDRLMAPLGQAETHQEALRTEIVRLQTFRAAALSALLARADAIPDSYDALLAVS